MKGRVVTSIMGTGFVVVDRVFSEGVERGAWVGGSCGNVLLSLAMLGHTAAPVIAIGDDPAGTHIFNQFRDAGASTEFIRRAREQSSPILVQVNRRDDGSHEYHTISPETGLPLPKYVPIEVTDLNVARNKLCCCLAFYADRVSPVILEAMRVVRDAGGLVFFEPSEVRDGDQFARAARLSSITKASSDRVSGPRLRAAVGPEGFAVTTQGVEGLGLWHRGSETWYPATPAPFVVDTSGAGDMLTVGMLDALLKGGPSGASRLRYPSDIHEGILAGQRLAAANCAFEGARGLFRELGAEAARSVLDG
jgi:fructokinase